MSAIPPKIRTAVHDRSGGICECGCGQRATHIHHRKLRSQGGKHDVANLLHLNHSCHERAHANRNGSGYGSGLLVRSTEDPASVPVVQYGRTA